MHQIHPNARTTPAIRAEIARSSEPSGLLARRYGVSAETIRKWRKRGVADCLDRSAKPHRLPWKATDEERAVVCLLRERTNFALDDLTFVVRHFLPHLNRDSIWRILKAQGLSRRRPAASERPARSTGKFRDYDLGFIHLDIKQLPMLQTADFQRRKRYLFVAIDRCSRSVHLAVKDDTTTKSAVAFLHEAAAAFPFRITHVLTDNGSCFSPTFEKACTELGARYRIPVLTRRKPTAWWSASTAASRARSWASPSIPTVTSSSCCAGSTPPITADDSGSCRLEHRTMSSPSALPPDESSAAPSLSGRPVPMISPRPASSSRMPRTSHNQTL
jgi:transposase